MIRFLDKKPIILPGFADDDFSSNDESITSEKSSILPVLSDISESCNHEHNHYHPINTPTTTINSDNPDIQNLNNENKTITWQGIKRTQDPECTVTMNWTVLKPFCFLAERLQNLFVSKPGNIKQTKANQADTAQTSDAQLKMRRDQI